MEGLSRFNEEKNQGRIKCVRIVDNITLSHLLFVDDVLNFLNGKISDSIMFNYTLNLFCDARGMVRNQDSSSLTTIGCR